MLFFSWPNGLNHFDYVNNHEHNQGRPSVPVKEALAFEPFLSQGGLLFTTRPGEANAQRVAESDCYLSMCYGRKQTGHVVQ